MFLIRLIFVLMITILLSSCKLSNHSKHAVNANKKINLEWQGVFIDVSNPHLKVDDLPLYEAWIVLKISNSNDTANIFDVGDEMLPRFRIISYSNSSKTKEILVSHHKKRFIKIGSQDSAYLYLRIDKAINIDCKNDSTKLNGIIETMQNGLLIYSSIGDKFNIGEVLEDTIIVVNRCRDFTFEVAKIDSLNQVSTYFKRYPPAIADI